MGVYALCLTSERRKKIKTGKYTIQGTENTFLHKVDLNNGTTLIASFDEGINLRWKENKHSHTTAAFGLRHCFNLPRIWIPLTGDDTRGGGRKKSTVSRKSIDDVPWRFFVQAFVQS